MTAVASPPTFQPLSRNGWSNGAGQQSLNAMSTDDLSRMLIPRKSAQRTSSSSSISSTASSTATTITPASQQPNGVSNGDAGWAARKKPARGLWPSSKAEPVSGLSTARPQSVPASTSGTSAAAAISSLQSPAPLLAQQQIMPPQAQQNGVPRQNAPTEPAAVLHLVPINATFDPKTITVPFTPDLVRVGRQTNVKTLPSPANGYFDSKVLSRQHAEIWAERDGKIWIRDVKSSNGTFVNGKRLSPENKESEAHPLKEQDILELGIDIVSEDQKTVVHHKVAARVEHAGIYSLAPAGVDLGIGDLETSVGTGLLAQPMSQGMKGRSASQGSNVSNTRFIAPGNMGGSGMVAAPYHAKWLQPITMEQIVKSLNTELRHARLQSQDLQHTGNFVDTFLANGGPSSKPQKPQNSAASKSDQVKARLATLPPAPPPSQPLPEAPIEAILKSKLHDIPHLLRRSDTEKPRTVAADTSPGNSPASTDPSHQILSLVEALATAQREIEEQGERLKQMEGLLQEEREGRRRAEERAGNSAGEGVGARTISDVEPAPPSTTESPDSSTLQQRLELMRVEMDEMKVQMERYRLRALNAEEEGERDRKSLAEMVENIRRRDEAVKRRREKRQQQRLGAGAVDSTSELPAKKDISVGTGDEDVDIDDFDEEVDRANDRLLFGSESHLGNGSTVAHMSSEELHQLGRAVSAAISSAQKKADGARPSDGTMQRSRRQEQLVQSAPYASILGVVLLGVGMMAYLNGWQRAAER